MEEVISVDTTDDRLQVSDSNVNNMCLIPTIECTADNSLEKQNESSVNVQVKVEDENISIEIGADVKDSIINKSEKPSVGNNVKKRKVYECTSCKKKGSPYFFKTKCFLADHVIKVHMNEEPIQVYFEAKPTYPCIICAENRVEQIFQSKSQYQAHLVSDHHTYLFMCNLCSLSFKLKANYKSHMLTHNAVAQKPFKCEVCNGTFVNRAGYEGHCKRFPGPHVKHTCSRCGVSFSKTSHIVNHRCKKLLIEEAKTRGRVSADKERTLAYEPPEEPSMDLPSNDGAVEETEDSEMEVDQMASQVIAATQLVHLQMGGSNVSNGTVNPPTPQHVYQNNSHISSPDYASQRVILTIANECRLTLYSIIIASVFLHIKYFHI